MPQFVIECSQDILKHQTEKVIISKIHASAHSSELFKESDIKVRIKSYEDYTIGNESHPFVYVFSTILSGRSTKQKAHLSKCIVETLSDMFPKVPDISINISEVDKTNYYNRKMLS